MRPKHEGKDQGDKSPVPCQTSRYLLDITSRNIDANRMRSCNTFAGQPERTVAFIVARLGSSRLPAKQFRKIGRTTLLDWLLDELMKCREIDQIVLATSAESENAPLLSWSTAQGISSYSYPGDVNRVTTRLRRAAENFSADICVLVSGDCPLIHAPAIDRMVSALKRHPEADFIAATSDSHGCLPALQGVSVAWRRTWQRADDLSDRQPLKEHHFPILYQRPDLFTCHQVTLPKEIYAPFHHRYSIDTWADLEFHNALYNTLADKNSPYSLPAAIELLRQDPSLLAINSHVHQKGVEEQSRKVLMVMDAGGDYGYGHLMRSRELALQLTERLGWPCTFLTGDQEARSSLRAVGFRLLPREITPPDLFTPEKIPRLPFFDLIILDLNSNNTLPAGWRGGLSRTTKVVVLDRLNDWTQESDLVIIPGVTAQIQTNKTTGAPPAILAGRDYVILRREISRLTRNKVAKDIDLLVYLHHKWQQDVIRKFAGKTDLSVHVIEQQCTNFHHLLARSRVLLSGFGVSFYEAVALGTYPVTWPFSAAHDRDARSFYRNLGLKPIMVPDDLREDELATTINMALGEQTGDTMKDGTPNIVREIKSLFEQP